MPKEHIRSDMPVQVTVNGKNFGYVVSYGTKDLADEHASRLRQQGKNVVVRRFLIGRKMPAKKNSRGFTHTLVGEPKYGVYARGD